MTLHKKKRWLAGAASAAICVSCLTRPMKEIEPQTSNASIHQVESNPIDKIDLLYVVDNSVSMADKQAIFDRAVPRMLERLIFPDCVKLDQNGDVVDRSASIRAAVPGESPNCETGWGLEFDPITDIHIGVISTSLGAVGISACDKSSGNDRALLLPKVRDGLPDPHGTGFLVWHPPEASDAPSTPTQSDFAQLSRDFRAHILGAGEEGCGYEAPLEAWYRFLVDPSPPSGFSVENDRLKVAAVDQEVLDQRAAFLRPDSLVGIVLLTDENDCSLMEGGSHYPAAQLSWMMEDKLSVSSSACEENPNDPCCFSCFFEPPDACQDTFARASCDDASSRRQAAHQDRPNTRCFDQQRRFGMELLYPTERYVQGLSSLTIRDSQSGEEVFNPLLMGLDGATPRPENLVFFAGITGVPYQDILDPAASAEPHQLRYLTANELNAPVDALGGENRWELIVGEPAPAALSSCEPGDASCFPPPRKPLDPFMIESISKRSGENPLVGFGPTERPDWNPINGHEQNNDAPFGEGTNTDPSNDDLQYACIFPLAPHKVQEVDCSQDNGDACDCQQEPHKMSPLCQNGPGAEIGTTQFYGKAYPAPRILEVLKGFGENSVVASICPKVHDESQRDYGYNPAVAAILDRLVTPLKGSQCLPRPLSVDDEGFVECAVLEVLRNEEGAIACTRPGRSAVSANTARAARRELESSGWCQGAECEQAVVCELEEHALGADRDRCLTGARGTEREMAAGYCYVDPDRGFGDPSLVAGCSVTERRLLRFVGEETPAAGSTTLIACTGNVVSQVPSRLE